ncbi:MAG: kelch repeat-containing protein [Planctomycetota bacterium]
MMRTLPLLALGLAAPLAAQTNATSTLMTYGDVLGAPSTLVLTELTPNTPVFLIPSFQNTGSPFLVGLTGDANDQLAVGVDLAANGNIFTGMSDATGRYSISLTIPNNPAFLDSTAYWQGWTEPGTSGTGRYDDFSNLRAMSLNNAARWQSTENAVPVASANLAFSTWETGSENGNPTRLFVCGGGPALLVDASTAYTTLNQCWEVDGVTGLHTLLPGTMNESRAFHNLVQLQDGRFMAIGGITGPFGSGSNFFTQVLRTCEIYDPVAGTWTTTPNMAKFRAGSTSFVMPDGRVLVAGGTEGNNAHELHDVADLLGTALKTTEIYNPTTNTWSSGPIMSEFKAGAMSVVLADGRWLVSGGITHTSLFGLPIPDFSNNQQIYNPTTNSWSNTGNLKAKRALGGMTLMDNGQVFIAGGGGGDIFNIGPIKKTETYNPATGSTTTRPNLSIESAFNTCVALPGNVVMIIGGAKGDLIDPIPLNNTWFYTHASATITAGPAMTEAHAGGVVVQLEDGTVYVGGGESNSGTATIAARSYSP